MSCLGNEDYYSRRRRETDFGEISHDTQEKNNFFSLNFMIVEHFGKKID